MKLHLLLAAFFLASCAVTPEYACNGSKHENFEPFFGRFLTDKAFSTARTLYPLETVSHEAGEEDGASRSIVTREEDSAMPPLQQFMDAHGMTYEVQSQSEDAAVVSIYKPNTDWMYELNYRNEKGCWLLTEIHDYSL